MKKDEHYLGSVRFYKHLIIFIVIFVILLPIAGQIFMLIQYGKMVRNYDSIINDQQQYTDWLEEKLAYYEEQQRENERNQYLEKRELEQIEEIILDEQEGAGAEEDAAEEDILRIPFEVDLEEVKYILVNNHHPLPRSYQLDLVQTKNGQMVHTEIKDSLEEMISDAKDAGYELIICSAYRDYEKQMNLVQRSIDRYLSQGYDYIEAYWSALCYLEMVGQSEHHTGLAVDLVGIDYQSLDEGQADTPESKWLSEHAHEYGFILRYPEGKEELTGILYESWHFRYVGEDAAAFIKEHQLCLEEFHALATAQSE